MAKWCHLSSSSALYCSMIINRNLTVIITTTTTNNSINRNHVSVSQYLTDESELEGLLCVGDRASASSVLVLIT